MTTLGDCNNSRASDSTGRPSL